MLLLHKQRSRSFYKFTFLILSVDSRTFCTRVYILHWSDTLEGEIQEFCESHDFSQNRCRKMYMYQWI